MSFMTKMTAAAVGLFILLQTPVEAATYCFEYLETDGSPASFTEIAENRWVNRAGGKVYSFELVRETPVFQEIKDKRRNLSVRLYMNGQVRWTDGKPMDWTEGHDWYPLGKHGRGKWLGERFFYMEAGYSLGVFFQSEDDLWINKAHGQTYSFKLAGKGEGHFDLADASRKMTVRIFSDGKVTWTVGDEWFPLGQEGRGKWLKTEDLSGKASWNIPVLVLYYFPVMPNGKQIDKSVTGDVGAPIEAVRRRCERMTMETILALQEGSRFRAYLYPDALPSLSYKVVGVKELQEELPRSKTFTDGDKWVPDYELIVKNAEIKNYIAKQGVKEVWIWAYHTGNMSLNESNMASKHGNISNSRRLNDMPVYDRTYTVYHYNYSRETNMAVHDHLHQIEALLRHHGPDLMRSFEGVPGNWRCGNCHFPPNGVKDYDYAIPRFVETDIEDWKAEGFGRKQKINSKKWADDDLNWYIYWMRSVPGRDNKLQFKGRPLTNWWHFIGDYDHAFENRVKLLK